MNKIRLNDILQLTNLPKVKLRFNIKIYGIPPIYYFSLPDQKGYEELLQAQYWNYSKRKLYKEGDITIGLIPVPNKNDCWLLFHVGRVTKDLNIQNGIGYEYETLPEYDKFIGKVVIRFKNNSQNLVRCADTTIEQCVIEQILPDVYNNNIFPGYTNINISWYELANLIGTSSWETALKNQKAVYLLIDSKTGKLYVGSASGEKMLYERWMCYIRTFHGGNKDLKRLDQDYIKNNFYFSILETFNQNVPDKIIVDRESYWKEVLRTRKFGYNKN